MKSDFWHERWQSKQIGFHQQEINPYLLRYWPELEVPLGSRVFVPLCGKSQDMLWLRQQGYMVVGIELSEIAVREFFDENALTYKLRQVNGLDCFEADGITLFCGDFFSLDAQSLGPVDAVYDRAALIALPVAMRAAYAVHLTKLMPARAKTLLVAFEYPQYQMEGPPFSVEEPEVLSLFNPDYSIRIAEDRDILEKEPRFRAKGIDRLHEKVYLLSPLAHRHA